jgi:hypothetical protein
VQGVGRRVWGAGCGVSGVGSPEPLELDVRLEQLLAPLDDVLVPGEGLRIWG